MFILIKCIDRSILVWGTYSEEKQAQDAMAEDLASEIGLDGVPASWDSVGAERYEDFDIETDSAWYNSPYHYDWKIIEVDARV